MAPGVPRKVLSSVGRSLRKVKINRIHHRNRNSSRYGAILPTDLDDDDDDQIIDKEVIGGIEAPSLLPSKSYDSNEGGPEKGMGIGMLRMDSKNMMSSSSRRSEDANILYGTEKKLRMACMVLGAFALGAAQGPSVLFVASKLLEYAMVAWITCLTMILISYWQHRQRQELPLSSVSTYEERQILLRQRNDQRHAATMKSSVEDDLDEEEIQNSTTTDNNMMEPIPVPKTITSSAPDELFGQHPDSRKLFVITSEGVPERISPNTVVPFENDFCEGKFIFMLRTPDADVDTAPKNTNNMNPKALEISEYFRPKQRRFAFQFQVRLKEIPKGAVYFGMEFDDPLKMGIIQRAVANAALGFVRKTNRGFHYSLTGGDASNSIPTDLKTIEKGEYEVPHLAFPLIGCMDIFVTTKPGEPIPDLGGEIYERPESIKSRKKGGWGDFTGWNLDDTYTLVFWSAYGDFLKWKCLNLPGIRPFSFCSLSGDQAINMTMYVLDGEEDEGRPHYVCNKNYIKSLEMSSSGKSTGKAVKLWQELKDTKNVDVAPLDEIDDVDIVDDIVDEAIDDRSADNTVVDIDDEDCDDCVMTDEVEDDDVVEQLGGGMYLKCGDPVVLREASQATGQMDNEYEEDVGFVTNSFGFAVMQSQSPSHIIFEKAGPYYQDPGRRNRSKSNLIRSGDTVRIKILTNNNNYKYLTLHKGWWLKWVSRLPRRNGYFKLYTNEREGNEDINVTARSIELQSTYLSIGGSFSLRHRRRSDFEVGIGLERSSKFGGCMLGLHRIEDKKNTPFQKLNSQSTIGDEGVVGDTNIPVAKDTKSKFKTFRICAHYANPMSSEHLIGPEIHDNQPNIETSTIRLDASAWIEMMHRTKRTRQRAYIVRVKHDDPSDILDDKETESNTTKCTMRLRTGQDLEPILQIGRSWKISTVITSANIDQAEFEREESKNDLNGIEQNETIDEFDNDLVEESEEGQESDGHFTDADDETDSGEEEQFHEAVEVDENEIDLDPTNLSSHESLSSQQNTNFWFDDIDYGIDGQPSFTYDRNGNEQMTDSDNENNINNKAAGQLNQNNDDRVDFFVEGTDNISPISVNGSKRRNRWIKTPTQGIGRVAKSVKKGTTVTSKQMVRQTVNATRFISKGIVHKKKKQQPARKEPRVRSPKQSKKRQKKKWKDHHETVNKVMKNYPPSNVAGTVLAAQMAAPDQSLRMVSHFLSEMTSLSISPSAQTQFAPLFSSKFGSSSELDTWFLRGDAAELGVTPSKNEGDSLISEALVARCLWESHWREEWCGLYEDHISFYAPLSKKAIFTLSLNDIKSVRCLDLPDDKNPLPGLPYLVIEGVWRCHYLAFSFAKTRDLFMQEINSAIFSYGINDPRVEHHNKNSGRERNRDTWKSNQWANFHSLDDSFLSDGRGKWARVSSNNKSKKRTILNSRRMAFDVESFYPSSGSIEDESSAKKTIYDAIVRFSEEVLAKALSISLNTMEKDIEGFARFLDLTSRLRDMPLNLLDLNSREAFCIFVNIYHCLLQHALLLDGAPSKRSVGHFMRCNCYEIGGTVFSLAELESSVIRGNLSRSINAKPPFVNAPKASKGYQIYSLTKVDARVNFVLNNGSSSNLSIVPVFNPEKLDIQLRLACGIFLQKNVSVDTKKRIITLPKVCEVYRNDFGDGTSQDCLAFCIKYLSEEVQETALDFLGENSCWIKYQPASESFHSSLSRMTDKS